MTKTNYKCFGTTFSSEIAFPEMQASEPSESQVQIRYGTVPEDIDSTKSEGVVYQASPSQFLLKMDGVARFLVENGNTITVEPEENADQKDLRIFVLGSCMGALLHQRGLLALHASAVEVDGSAVLFSGVSGAGKSTTAAAFQAQGCPVLSDDISALEFQDGKVVVHPGLNRMKLWQNSALHLGHEIENLELVRNEVTTRFVLPVNDAPKESLEVKAIFLIGGWNKEDFSMREVGGAAAFRGLLRNTYRARYMKGLDNGPAHFQLATALAQQAQISVLRRPQHPLSTDKVIELVKESLA